MIHAMTTRFNRYVFTALPLFALLTLSAGCGSDNGGTGVGGAGGSGATGGAGGSGGSGGAGGSGGTAGSAGTGGAGGSDAGGGTGIHGLFTVTIYEEPPPAYTKLVGQIYNGPQPPSQLLKLDMQEGDCRLYVPKT